MSASQLPSLLPAQNRPSSVSLPLPTPPVYNVSLLPSQNRSLASSVSPPPTQSRVSSVSPPLPSPTSPSPPHLPPLPTPPVHDLPPPLPSSFPAVPPITLAADSELTQASQILNPLGCKVPVHVVRRRLGLVLSSTRLSKVYLYLSHDPFPLLFSFCFLLSLTYLL